MIEQYSLLKELKTAGFDAAIFSTFNCYIPFLEEVVIRRLIATGCRHNVVLADSSQLSHSLQSNPPLRAGRDYWLLPIEANKAFHPKLSMFVGKDKGLLFVGSHNLTFSGYGSNREVTNVITYNRKVDTSELPLFQAAFDYLRGWAERSKGGAVTEALDQFLELAPWLKQQDDAKEGRESYLLVGGVGMPSLLSQISELANGEADTIVASGAFFDSKLEFLAQLSKQFKPQRFLVPIQPETVQIPPSGVDLNDVKFIDANILGTDKARYLHAKFVYLVMKNGEHIFASGSANPSRPAWIESGEQANDEAMFVLCGNAAKQAVDALGIDVDSLASQTALDVSHWDEIGAQWEKYKEETKFQDSIFLSLAECNTPGTIVLSDRVPKSATNFQFIGQYNEPLSIEYESKYLDGQLILTFEKSIEVSLLQEIEDGEVVGLYLVHYQRILAEHARTGAQRKFRSSLASLDANDPELSALFKCVEQVILSPPADNIREAVTADGTKAKAKGEAPASLEVGIDTLSNIYRRKRMAAGTDLGYILNLLINSFNQATSDNYHAADSMGRNEEEQVGEDDETVDSGLSFQKTEEEQEKLLALCHKKVGTLTQRLVRELGKKLGDNFDLLIKLAATLALMRHLKCREASFWWVNTKKGNTAVPADQLKSLAEAIMGFVESNPEIMTKQDEAVESFVNFDEVGRLKGLIFWLVLETGIELDFEPKFNETTSQMKERIQMNASIITLGEMMANDELAVVEARDSLQVTNVVGLASLQKVISLSGLVKDQRDSLEIENQREPEQGGLAFHPSKEALGIRCVLSCDESRVFLASLGNNQPKQFEVGRLSFLSARDVHRELSAVI